MDILHQEWAQGIKTALKAYSRASDAAYAPNLPLPAELPLQSVTLWALLIAAGVLLLEWLVARHVPPG
jgi:hypothetical protein